MPLGSEGMKRIPIVNVSTTEYRNLMGLCEKSKLRGREGSILLGLAPQVAIKVFHLFSEYTNPTILKNKSNKLDFIYNIPNFDNEIKPLALLCYQQKLFSYAMTTDQNMISLLSAVLTKEQREFYLRSSKEQSEYFHKLGLVCGDVKANNILINQETKKTSFCDLDNIQVKDKYPVDILPYYIEMFSDADGFMEPKVDYYTHNLMTLSELDGNHQEYDEILAKLDSSYPFDFLEENASLTLHEMRKAIYDYKGDYLIDYVKVKKK